MDAGDQVRLSASVPSCSGSFFKKNRNMETDYKRNLGARGAWRLQSGLADALGKGLSPQVIDSGCGPFLPRHRGRGKIERTLDYRDWRRFTFRKIMEAFRVHRANKTSSLFQRGQIGPSFAFIER